ncbi:MAG: hypothetical protein PQJ58_04625 [Spirochaetales bacterium]|nr:hypothetical protein [Spirochaetales bacterium]
MLSYAEEAPENENNENIRIEYHSMGDQVFGINAGLFIPLFMNNPSLSWGDSEAFKSTNLSVGGSGSLYYGAYINNNIILGLQVGAIFSSSPNDHNFYMIPITFKGTYEFQFFQNLISVPLSLGAGINMSSYQDNFHVDMILKPEAGVYWNYNSDWSFGLNTSYWWVPQIYKDREYSRIGNFMDVSLSAIYNF